MKPFAWSYSALVRYENCPKQYYHLNVIKDFKDEDSDFSAEGKIVHDSMYKRVVHGKPLPIELRHLEALAKKFADTPGTKKGELKLALNRSLEPVEYFAPDVWVRVVIDLLVVQDSTGIVVDWKTGKRKPDHTQLGLSTAVLARWMPELDLFKTLYVWTRSRELDPKNYTASKLMEIWNGLLPRVQKMEDARKTTDFPANKTPLCKYCPVASCPNFVPR